MIHLGPDERIVATARKHVFVLIGELLPICVLLALPFFVLPFIPESVSLSRFIPSEEEIIVAVSIDNAVILFSLAIWSLLLWMRLFWIWLDYYLDVWIITNHRLIDIEQKGFFNRNVANVRLDFIQDVTFEINGVIASLFNFGSIEIQTAGEMRHFTLHGVSHPEKLRDILVQIKTEEKKGKSGVSGVEFEEDDEFNRMINRDVDE